MRRDIQGLRALAVLAVVSAHAFGWPRGGFVGVDVFFVISGFVITGMLLRELREHGRIALGSFYARRARRILPASLVTIGAVVATSFVVFNSVRADQTMWDGVWAALLSSNWHFAAVGTDYFHASDVLSPLQHFWSLSVEEQFYLVWPGLLLIVALGVPLRARRGRRVIVIVGVLALVGTATSFGWAVLQSAADPAPAYFSTFTRVWEFTAGALLAVGTPVLRKIPPLLGAAMSVLGTAGIVAACLTIGPSEPGFPGPWAAFPVAAAALALAGGVTARQSHLFVLTNPLSVFVGNLSYSLYLWHFPVIVFAAVLLPVSDWSMWIILGAIAVLSLASYLIIEQPLRYSPLLGGRVPRRLEPARDAPQNEPSNEPESPRVPVRVELAAAVSTRPAGWTAGARYYPGSVRQPAPCPEVGPSGTVPPPLAPTAARATPVPPVPPAPHSAPLEVWRERFGKQVMLATSGLVVVALGGVLALQITHGGFAFAPVPPTAAAQVSVDDPTAALQADLAAAAHASTWPELHPSLDEVIAASSGSNPAHGCFAPSPAPTAADCTWGSADADIHLYVVGDSTAMAYAPAFRKIAEDSGGAVRITTIGLYGCRFTEAVVHNDGAGVMDACPQRKADVAAMIAADRPDLVVVSNAFTLGQTPSGENLSAADLITSQAALAATYGLPGRVVYLDPPPEGAPLSNCYSPVTSPYACATAVTSTWSQMHDAAVQIAASSGDHSIDALPFSCWEGVCPAFTGSLPIRYDQTHLTVSYSEHIARYLRWALSGIGPFA